MSSSLNREAAEGGDTSSAPAASGGSGEIMSGAAQPAPTWQPQLQHINTAHAETAHAEHVSHEASGRGPVDDGTGSGVTGPAQAAPTTQQDETVEENHSEDSEEGGDEFEDAGSEGVDEVIELGSFLSGSADGAGPSTSAAAGTAGAAGLRAHPIAQTAQEVNEQAELDAAWQEAFGPDGSGLDALGGGSGEGGQGRPGSAGGGNMAGVLGSILGGMRSAAAAAGSAVAAGKEVVGKHVQFGAERRGTAAAEMAKLRLARSGASSKKDQSLRSVARQKKKQEEKTAKVEAAKKARAMRAREEEEENKLVSSANMELMSVSLQKFAEACRKGDRGALHLAISDIFSPANKAAMERRGMPVLQDLPWKPRTLPDFIEACFVLAIRASGGVDLVNELEKMCKEHQGETEKPIKFENLVNSAATEEDAWKARLGQEGSDREAFLAKRALVHEWIEQGYTDVLRKALSLKPLCIRAPEEPPLVTALRKGHSFEVISLLVDPVVNRRTDKDPLKAGVDQASPTDGATAISLAIQAGRMDVLREILRHSSRWSMLVGSKTWTPLCYALAQGRSAMVPLLLAHAKRRKTEAADLAEYVNEVCDGATALHRAVAANAPDMVRLLLEAGADPAIRTREGGKATSALHLAARSE